VAGTVSAPNMLDAHSVEVSPLSGLGTISAASGDRRTIQPEGVSPITEIQLLAPGGSAAATPAAATPAAGSAPVSPLVLISCDGHAGPAPVDVLRPGVRISFDGFPIAPKTLRVSRVTVFLLSGAGVVLSRTADTLTLVPDGGRSIMRVKMDGSTAITRDGGAK